MLSPWIILAILLVHFGMTVLFISLVTIFARRFYDPIPGMLVLATLYIGWLVGATYGVRIYFAA